MAKRLFEIVLREPTEGDPKGRVVEMMEMGTSAVFQADKTVGKNAGAMQTKVEYLRYCIVKDGDEDLNWQALQGSKAWDERFSFKETMQLALIWNQIHEPGEDDVEGLGEAWRVKSGH